MSNRNNYVSKTKPYNTSTSTWIFTFAPSPLNPLKIDFQCQNQNLQSQNIISDMHQRILQKIQTSFLPPAFPLQKKSIARSEIEICDLEAYNYWYISHKFSILPTTLMPEFNLIYCERWRLEKNWKYFFVIIVSQCNCSFSGSYFNGFFCTVYRYSFVI